MNLLRKVFGHGWLLGLLVVILLALLIFFGGPYLSLGEWQPFESLVGRLVGILLLVVGWGAYTQYKLLRSQRRGTQLAEAVAGQEEAAAVQPAGAATASSATAADAQALRDRFGRAVSALRKSRRGASLYDLPWYVIIGAPGSGKTTALVNAGLEFPLESEFGRDPLKGVGGTRNCDWWITDQAILLDTAGRYATQDANEIADRSGWMAFMELLKRYRRRRPINGVLVAVSLADLMQGDESERARHAAIIRRRLEELHEQLRIPFPVYLLLTKADLIAGFAEFFDDLNQAGRAQVWGTTFALGASQGGQAVGQLGSEYDLLVARLQERVIERLGEERDLTRRAAIHAFPAQVGGLKPLVADFVKRVFEGPGLSEQVWLRGCYFTSGTQEGTPIDRMLGALAQNFGLDPRAVARPSGRGKSYFLETLLKGVVFEEAGLAGVNRRLEWRQLAGGTLAYAAMALLTGLVLILLVVSYRANRDYLNDMSALVGQILPESAPLDDVAGNIGAALPRLDALRLMLDSADAHDGHPPLTMRWGLYQGHGAARAAGDAYRRDLNAMLGPWVGQQFAGQLRAAGAEPDRLYEYLKGYLMLGQPERLDPAQVQLIGRAVLGNALPEDPALAQRLAAHFDAWVAEPARLVPIALDDALVSQARASLQQASVPLLMYSRLRLAHAADSAGQIRLDNALNLGSEALFVRRSGRSLSEPLPALYTRAAFEEFNRTGRPALVKQFLADSWVLGEGAAGLTESPRLAGEVLALYEADYIRAWDSLLSDLTLRPFGDANDAMTALALLASPSSPLKALLVLVEEHTHLTRPAAPGADVAGQAAAAAGKALSGTGTLGALLGGEGGGAAPGTQVTEHFARLHQLVSGPPGGAPIDRTLADLNQLQQQLRQGAAGGAAGAGVVAQVLGQLAVVAAQLPPPINEVIREAGSQGSGAVLGEARTELGNRYRTQVVAQCRELLGNRYPFNRSSAVDVAVADFGRVFGPGGVYDSFFQAQLAAFVDTSRTTWRWKEDTRDLAAVPLAPFQQAERIRQAFFAPGSPAPTLQFTLVPESLDAAVDRFVLNLDGQTLEYSHGPRQPMAVNWPAAIPAGASYAFEERSGSRPNQSFAGAWALFRLLDAGTLSAQSPTQFSITLTAGGRTAQLTLHASSVRNPFAHPELLRFRCGG